ncbi:hypothetical protein ABPG75_000477 [Micractinium tetrahymenae]
MGNRSNWDDFEVQRELGHGTWGTVLLARRRLDGEFYALKVVQLDKRSHRDQLAAVQECQVLASLDSPHITRYYDSFLHEGRLVIVMEWAPGGSLHAAIGRSPRPLPEEAIWRVLLHISLALHHMHNRRMLHRDVKSLNVFLTGPLDGQGRHTQFKLGDVGVSKVLEEGKSHASTLIGTPFYLSPEICQEKPYDAKSDIWALGVVLYECATRRHPFDAQSQPSLIMKILRGRYEPVLGLSTDLTAIINRCLSQAAARRPSAERLLSLPCVRAKAAELGIELPAAVLAAPPASPGGSFSVGDGLSARKRSALPGLQAVADARRSSNGGAGLRPTGRRATCPHGPTPLPPGVDRPPRPVVGRRSTPHIVFEERRLSGAERHNLRMKPPLPAAAVPRRRQTEQAAAVNRQPLLGSLQGESAVQLQGLPAGPAPATPLQAGIAAAMAAAAAVASPRLAPTPAAPAQPAPPSAAAVQQPTPRRHSHFSVTKHMRALSGAAQQWLAQRSSVTGSTGEGGSEDAALPADSPAAGAAAAPVPALAPVVAAAMAVERSAVSDSVLLVPPRRLAEQAEAAALTAEASVAEEDEEEEDGEESEREAMLSGLRQRCVGLLGSEHVFQELYSLAQSAMAEGGSGTASAGSGDSAGSGGAAAAPRPPTVASLADALFARVGYSSNAAEALHLLMRMLAME